MFYNNYVDLCNKRGVSPSAAAEEMGFHRSDVTRWSKGSPPRQATLQRVADYFGVPINGLTGAQKEPPHPEAEAVGPNKRALLDVIDKMSEAEMILLLERAKRIIESRG